MEMEFEYQTSSSSNQFSDIHTNPTNPIQEDPEQIYPFFDETLDAIQVFLKKINREVQVLRHSHESLNSVTPSSLNLIQRAETEYEDMFSHLRFLILNVDDDLSEKLSEDVQILDGMQYKNIPIQDQILEISKILTRIHETLRVTSVRDEFRKTESLPRIYCDLNQKLNSLLAFENSNQNGNTTTESLSNYINTNLRKGQKTVHLDSESTLHENSFKSEQLFVADIRTFVEPNLKLGKAKQLHQWQKGCIQIINEQLIVQYTKEKSFLFYSNVTEKTKTYSLKKATIEPTFMVSDPHTLQIRLLTGMVIVLRFANEKSKSQFIIRLRQIINSKNNHTKN